MKKNKKLNIYLDNCCFNRPYDYQNYPKVRLETEAIIRSKGMDALISSLGKVDAERFITSIIREPFDYTLWQEDLFKDMSIEELSKKAMENYEN